MNNFNNVPIIPDFYSIFSSFLLVMLLLGIVLFVLKKIQSSNSITRGNRRIKVLEVFTANNKQKIMLIEVEANHFLIGFTGNQINSLGQWPVNSKSNNHLDNKEVSISPSNLEQNQTISAQVKKPKDTIQIKKPAMKNYDHKSQFFASSEENSNLQTLKNFSDVKQTENLLNFAKKIRGSLDKSLGVNRD